MQILNHICATLQIVAHLSSFRLDMPTKNNKKNEKKLKLSFYDKLLIVKWESKIFCLHKQVFINICGKLLYVC